jgi:hypothetical protein
VGPLVTAPLRITLRAPRQTADLADFLPLAGPPLLQRLHTRSGAVRLTVSTATASGDTIVRDLLQYRLHEGRWHALDRTRFVVDPEHFAEAERYTSQSGPNLHPVSIRLPRRLTVGTWHRPVPGGRVCLAAAGSAWLSLGGGAPLVTDVIALLAAHGKERRIQWLARGLGEVCLGPPKGPPDSWMVGAQQADHAWLGGVSDADRTAPRVPLPEEAPAIPAGLL